VKEQYENIALHLPAQKSKNAVPTIIALARPGAACPTSERSATTTTCTR
ncbi:hypothetical protein LSAT2_030782, partial [Lamellibrachia satsuma]